MGQQVRDFLEMEGPRVIKNRFLSPQNNKDSERHTICSNGMDLPRHLLNLLLFYLEHATTTQLETFIQEIAAIRGTERGKVSICCYALFNSEVEEIEKFMKLLSDKLGDDAVEQLVLHKNDVVFFACDYQFQYEKKVPAMYAHLPKKKRDDIQHKLLSATSDSGHMEEQLKKWKGQSMKWVKHYLGIDDRGVATDLPDGFNVLSLHFIENFDNVQLRQFIELIVSVKIIFTSEGNHRRYSIWADYVDKACAVEDDVINEQRNCQAIGKLFKCITQKLDKNIVQEKLLLHDDDLVIDRTVSTCNFHMFGVMLHQLNVWDQQRIFDDTFVRLEFVERICNKNYEMNKLKGFVDFILEVKEIDDGHCTRPYSIWSDFTNKACKEIRIEKVLYFFDFIQKKLGDDQMKRLMNHDVNGKSQRVILRIQQKISVNEKLYSDNYPMLTEYLMNDEDNKIPATYI